MNFPKYILLVFLIIFDIYILKTYEGFLIASLLAFINLVLLLRLLKNNLWKELMLSGLFLAILESYHFYLQSALSFTPLNDNVLVFFGVYIFLRAIVGIGALFYFPILTEISNIIIGG